MYFEDINVGDSVIISPVRVDSEKMIKFAKQFNPAPIHTDEKIAAGTKAGRITASGLYTFALMWAGFVKNDFGGNETIAGKRQELEYYAPVFAGDILHGVAKVTEKKERNPYNGLIIMNLDIYNQENVLVLRNITETVVKRKPQQ